MAISTWLSIVVPNVKVFAYLFYANCQIYMYNNQKANGTHSKMMHSELSRVKTGIMENICKFVKWLMLTEIYENHKLHALIPWIFSKWFFPPLRTDALQRFDEQQIRLSILHARV